MADKTVKSVITPNDQFIRDVFSRTKAYYLDIYQREYKWQKTNVETLLNDIDVHFNLHSRDKSEPKDIRAGMCLSILSLII